MAQFSATPFDHARGNLHLVVGVHQTARPTVRAAVAHSFFDLGKSVRKLRDLFRYEHLAERDVEDILREFHRNVAARAGVISHLRRLAA